MTRTIIKHRRPAVAAALVMAGALVMSACNGEDAADATEEDQDLVLDLESGQAETELGTVDAQRADHSYVTALGEGQAIGIVPAAGVGAEPDDDEQLAVYVYDRDELAVMTGTLDADASGTFTSGENADFDTTVELTMGRDAVSGTVAVDDGQPVEFTAQLADGDAGVYWAHGATDEPDLRCDWVVLADGSQWGCVCAPPVFANPCCQLRQ